MGAAEEATAAEEMVAVGAEAYWEKAAGSVASVAVEAATVRSHTIPTLLPVHPAKKHQLGEC